MENRLVINERQRLELTGISRSSWYRWEQAGLVPKRIQLGPRRVGWRLAEIEEWLESRAESVPAAAP